ncbi:MAG: LysM peptidoglycan-binding domain-containing protein [Opitutaceae bacterium]
MKILKVFGAVVGIHVFALILIFANPGCSAMTKTAPAPDTTAKADTPSPAITVPTIAGSDSTAYAASSSIHYSPTRPNTPAAGALETEPVSDVTPASTYTVSKGDSMSSVAHKNHLTKAELAAANHLKSDSMLKLGQKLIIPGKATTPASMAAKNAASGMAKETVAAPKGPADSVKHTVKAGETLGAIARKYQVKMSDIAYANNISDPAKIRPGTELIIPGWQTTAGKNGKSGAKTVSKSAPDSAKAAGIPTISIPGEDSAAPAITPAADSPPVIQVEESPATK